MKKLLLGVAIVAISGFGAMAHHDVVVPGEDPNIESLWESQAPALEKHFPQPPIFWLQIEPSMDHIDPRMRKLCGDQGDCAWVDQFGEGNFADIAQGAAGVVGGGNIGDIIQIGFLNSAGITQTNAGAPNSGVITQDGFFNSGRIDQVGFGDFGINKADIEQLGGANAAQIVQFGSGNRSKVLQDGFFNVAFQLQDGDENMSTIHQDGFFNHADSEQIGDRNSQITTQFGSDNMSTNDQFGNDNKIWVLEDGFFNRSSVLQTGDKNMSTTLQFGDFNLSLVEQTGFKRFPPRLPAADFLPGVQRGVRLPDREPMEHKRRQGRLRDPLCGQDGLPRHLRGEDRGQQRPRRILDTGRRTRRLQRRNRRHDRGGEEIRRR